MATRDQAQTQLAAVIGDKYEVLEWIGGGGMGEVFLARHRVHGGRFAVKVLADHLAGEREIVDRFLQEARTAASLSGHPNIVSIFDVGESGGLHYLIMQYVEGEDLAALLKRQGKLSPTRAAAIMGQAAEALEWAHARGVVHRDLKPANIRLDTSGRVILLDFGIAKATDVPTGLTRTGERLGTPFYMSPEQLRGETCDARSDLYSLGVAWFEVLTGTKPFTGDNYYAMEHAHLNTPAPSPAQIDPSIPPEHCRMVLRLLEKDPAQRYQSASELAAELKAAVEAPRAAYQATTPGGDSGPRLSHSKTWLYAIVGVVLAVVLAVVAIGFVLPVQRPVEPPVEPQALAGQIETPTGPMRLVPAGNFTFGDAAEGSPNPPRSVFLPAFYIDATEVSNAAYKQFCDATGYRYPESPPWDRDYFASKPNYPVVNVTLTEARAYANWAGKRLPSEEEWEKAARGVDGRLYPWGSEPPDRKANLAGADDGFEFAAPVDSFPGGASPHGARHMAGNVWEWTVTPYPVSRAEIADMKAQLPSVGSAWYVAKGGSFAGTDAAWARAFVRQGFPVSGSSPFIGLRCVRDAKQ